MHNPQSIVMLLLESILTGFGIVIPILALIRTSNLKTIAVKDLFILTAVQMVRLVGIAYCIVSTVHIWEFYSQNPALKEMATDDKFFLWHWASLFYSPVIAIIITQLFWVRKIYMRKTALVILALLLLILTNGLFKEYFINWISPYGKYGSLWLNYPVIMRRCLEGFLNIIVFIFITFAVMLSSGKLKKIYQR